MTDPEKSILSFAMLWVKEFYGAGVRPDGLSLFKPDPVLAIVGPGSLTRPIQTACNLYAIVYTKSMRNSEAGEGRRHINSREGERFFHGGHDNFRLGHESRRDRNMFPRRGENPRRCADGCAFNTNLSTTNR